MTESSDAATTRRGFLRNLTAMAAASAAASGAAGFWGRSAAGGTPPLRPPGAIPEDDFVSTCIRCMRCVDACPNHCLESSGSSGTDAGTPTLNPRRQACMLCSRIEGEYLRCTAVCPSGALRPVRKEFQAIRDNVRIGIARIDLNLCYSYNNYTCGTCFYACPMGAIKVGLWERPQLIADACVGCGLCERACIRYPQAIRVEPAARPGGPA